MKIFIPVLSLFVAAAAVATSQEVWASANSGAYTISPLPHSGSSSRISGDLLSVVYFVYDVHDYQQKDTHDDMVGHHVGNDRLLSDIRGTCYGADSPTRSHHKDIVSFRDNGQTHIAWLLTPNNGGNTSNTLPPIKKKRKPTKVASFIHPQKPTMWQRFKSTIFPKKKLHGAKIDY